MHSNYTCKKSFCKYQISQKVTKYLSKYINNFVLDSRYNYSFQKVIKYMRKYWKSNEYSNAVTCNGVTAIVCDCMDNNGMQFR